MLATFIATLLGLAMPAIDDAQADALRSTAPTYLTLDTAREHLATARAVGLATGIDPNLLLSVAWHESRYDFRATTPEPLGKTSCGVMTPVPMARCTPTTLLAGYMAGAQHLRDWIDATHHLRTALIGYAGGYVGIKFCRDPANAHDYRCGTPDVFLYRARMIREATRKATRKATRLTPVLI